MMNTNPFESTWLEKNNIHTDRMGDTIEYSELPLEYKKTVSKEAVLVSSIVILAFLIFLLLLLYYVSSNHSAGKILTVNTSETEDVFVKEPGKSVEHSALNKTDSTSVAVTDNAQKENISQNDAKKASLQIPEEKPQTLKKQIPYLELSEKNKAPQNLKRTDIVQIAEEELQHPQNQVPESAGKNKIPRLEMDTATVAPFKFCSTAKQQTKNLSDKDLVRVVYEFFVENFSLSSDENTDMIENWKTCSGTEMQIVKLFTYVLKTGGINSLLCSCQDYYFTVVNIGKTEIKIDILKAIMNKNMDSGWNVDLPVEYRF